jgi:hypothetical protein
MAIFEGHRQQNSEHQEEHFLFLHVYKVDGKIYHYFEYYRSREEAQKNIDETNKSAPHIQTVSLTDCQSGYYWNKRYFPYTLSEYRRLEEEKEWAG